MILEPDQFEKYKTTMGERVIEVSKQDHTIHGYMVYQCEHCNSIYVMWLEKGLEDPTEDEKTGMHKPVPFGFTCLFCGDIATHRLWDFGKNSLGKNYKSYQKYVEQPNRFIYRNFFWNDPTTDCGVPIIFEPDYYSERLRGRVDYITEIYINTLPVNDHEEVISVIDTLNGVSFDDFGGLTTLLDLKGNREQKRHGPFGRDGYKRPRSNKKLYEY